VCVEHGWPCQVQDPAWRVPLGSVTYVMCIFGALQELTPLQRC
jgi:hypothetical protein